MAIKKTKPKPVAEADPASLVAYKGFDKNLQCRGFQYEIGATYDNGGAPVERCGPGAFHSCEHPLDILNYYPPVDGNRFASVSTGGKVAREPGSDTKIASAKITINAELSLGELGRSAVKWVADMTKKAAHAASGTRAHSATAGDGAHSATAGDWAHSATAGDGAHSATAGYGAHSATVGDWAHSATAGDGAHSATAGYGAHSATAGDGAHSATAGYGAHSATAGDGAHSATVGDWAHSATAGDGAHSATAGTRAHSSTAGDGAHAAVKGANSIAAALGRASTATAVAGSAIMLAAYDTSHYPPKLAAVRASMVGENGIEPEKTYRLTVAGEFEEVSQ